MEYLFRKMTQESATTIADVWKYEGQYAFYDMTADMEDYEELISEEARNQNDYYEALADRELVGFFCAVRDRRDLEIGLGLRPDLCGRGLGGGFLKQIMAFVGRHYQYDALIVRVATFNQRAIRVYRACGFADDGVYTQLIGGASYEFLKMIKK